MCTCPFLTEVTPITFEGTAFYGTFLTPVGMLMGYSIHIQAKA